jgi:hypothetical protein
MKTFKTICAAAILALSLSVSAHADSAPGDQHTPGRNIAVSDDTGTPTPAPETAGFIGAAPAVDNDISFPTLADILWALASIY